MESNINERVNTRVGLTQGPSDPHLVPATVRDFLNMRRLQGRLNVRQTAVLLNCGEHDIPVLVSHGLITPLGHPPPNSQKYFSPVEILQLAGDAERMGQICDALYRHWQVRNAAKTGALPSPQATPNGGDGLKRRTHRN